jgi:hypothetical protein
MAQSRMKLSLKTESQCGAACQGPLHSSLQMKSRSGLIFKSCFGRDYVYLGVSDRYRPRLGDVSHRPTAGWRDFSRGRFWRPLSLCRKRVTPAPRFLALSGRSGVAMAPSRMELTLEITRQPSSRDAARGRLRPQPPTVVIFSDSFGRDFVSCGIDSVSTPLPRELLLLRR